ncbi:hypothetical protein V6N12_051540 [Hibiscus sabdariffa]|uniref:DDT domain-containing protein n=1 Tax=Hibiscus sabdariffa TaxID=183260 RepID=A0ABR2GGN2_9ROSI
MEEYIMSAIIYEGDDPKDYLEACYRRDDYLKAYKHMLHPMKGPMFWPKSNAELILPPTRRKKHGRPQKEMRREELEGPKKSKMSRVGRVMKCSICRLEEDDFHGGYQTLTRISTSPRALRQKKKKRTLKQLFSPKRRPRGRPRKRRRPEEENESLVADAKFNNSKTRKRVLETRSVAFVGRYVLKEFGRRAFLGKIVSYDTGLYRVDYEDGDFEDLESGELRELILEETNFDDNLSRRKVRLDELVLNRIVKESELEEKKKKLEVLKNEVDGVETSSVSKLVVENDGEQDKDGADSSSDSCEHANDRELSLESEIPLIPPPILPPSSGTIGVPEECVSHLFSVYGFLRSFSIILFLNPFRLDDFVGSLNCSEPNPLLDAVHVALMRALSCHLETISSEGSELASKCLRSK